MAIVKKIKQGYIVVNQYTGDPVIKRVFKSKLDALNFAQKLTPNFY